MRIRQIMSKNSQKPFGEWGDKLYSMLKANRRDVFVKPGMRWIFHVNDEPQGTSQYKLDVTGDFTPELREALWAFSAIVSRMLYAIRDPELVTGMMIQFLHWAQVIWRESHFDKPMPSVFEAQEPFVRFERVDELAVTRPAPTFRLDKHPRSGQLVARSPVRRKDTDFDWTTAMGVLLKDLLAATPVTYPEAHNGKANWKVAAHVLEAIAYVYGMDEDLYRKRTSVEYVQSTAYKNTLSALEELGGTSSFPIGAKASQSGA